MLSYCSHKYSNTVKCSTLLLCLFTITVNPQLILANTFMHTYGIISVLNRNNENAVIGADTFHRIENWTRRNYNTGFNPRAARNRRPDGNGLLGTFAIISVRRIYVAYGKNCGAKGRREKRERERGAGSSAHTLRNSVHCAIRAPGRS